MTEITTQLQQHVFQISSYQNRTHNHNETHTSTAHGEEGKEEWRNHLQNDSTIPKIDCLAPTKYEWTMRASQEIPGIAFIRHSLFGKVK